ncbi:MAG: HAD-IB family hydrolase [Candidatus Binatia bacterium]|nr:HAD-IB family hydrolase [Candidatus Binatia bacterium]
MVGRTAAFFDIDGTLLAVHSAPHYARYMRKHGRARRRDLLRTAYYLLQYRLNLLDMEGALERASELIVGQEEAEVAAFSLRWYEDVMREHLVPVVCDLLAQHQRRGDTVALLSTTTSYLADPIARDLGVDHSLVTRLEVEDGRFTGRADGPICYGRGKVFWAKKFAEEEDVDLAQSYFYTDSVTDVPVLELVGHPRIVQPDRLLRREARRRGWSVVPTDGAPQTL